MLNGTDWLITSTALPRSESSQVCHVPSHLMLKFWKPKVLILIPILVLEECLDLYSPADTSGGDGSPSESRR